MKLTGPRGHQHVHTLSIYDDTWKKFEKCKHIHNMTSDELLNKAIDSYLNRFPSIKKQTLISIKNEIQKMINNLK